MSFQNLHEFFSGDGFVFIQVFCQLMQFHDIVLQNLQCFLMLLSYQLDHFFVDQRLCLEGATQGGITAQILVADIFHRHNVKLIAHTVTRHHTPCQYGLLF